MKVLTEAEACYLAAFIDGDGSIVAQIVSRKDYVNLFQIRVSVLCVQKMSRVYILTEMQSQVGAGTVRDRGDGIGEFAVVGHKNVYNLLKQIEPFLRIKRKQAHLVMKICEQLYLTTRDPYKLLELCGLADQVGKLNDSKNRTVTQEVVERALIDSGKISK